MIACGVCVSIFFLLYIFLRMGWLSVSPCVCVYVCLHFFFSNGLIVCMIRIPVCVCVCVFFLFFVFLSNGVVFILTVSFVCVCVFSLVFSCFFVDDLECVCARALLFYFCRSTGMG